MDFEGHVNARISIEEIVRNLIKPVNNEPKDGESRKSRQVKELYEESRYDMDTVLGARHDGFLDEVFPKDVLALLTHLVIHREVIPPYSAMGLSPGLPF